MGAFGLVKARWNLEPNQDPGGLMSFCEKPSVKESFKLISQA